MFILKQLKNNIRNNPEGKHSKKKNYFMGN